LDPDVGDSAALVEFQTASDSGFVTVVVASGGITPAQSWTVPTGTLAASTRYWWRARYKDNRGTWGYWSTAFSFDTGSPPPEANFYISNAWGRPPLEVRFADASTAGGSPIFEWAWDFHDGHTLSGEEPNPTHVYEHEGVYPVSLTVTTLVGSSTRTAMDAIVVNDQMPVAPWGLLVAGITLAAVALRYRKLRR
jgi:PKD repeat protein